MIHTTTSLVLLLFLVSRLFFFSSSSSFCCFSFTFILFFRPVSLELTPLAQNGNGFEQKQTFVMLIWFLCDACLQRECVCVWKWQQRKNAQYYLCQIINYLKYLSISMAFVSKGDMCKCRCRSNIAINHLLNARMQKL